MTTATRPHPEHHNTDRFGLPVLPNEPKGLRLRWRLFRECRRNGGHWWHPADPMIEWGCCVCGARRDGAPKDGT